MMTEPPGKNLVFAQILPFFSQSLHVRDYYDSVKRAGTGELGMILIFIAHSQNSIVILGLRDRNFVGV